jgi:hypothetical protein
MLTTRGIAPSGRSRPVGAGSEILQALARIEGKLDRMLAGRWSGSDVAPDSDLDSQWGDEQIKKSPPRWTGDDFAGANMSGCSADFLRCFAEFKDYCADRDAEKAEKAEGDERAKLEKYARFNRRSAARARGWIKRLESGWKAPAAANGGDEW